jgi:hypothetical protein
MSKEAYAAQAEVVVGAERKVADAKTLLRCSGSSRVKAKESLRLARALLQEEENKWSALELPKGIRMFNKTSFVSNKRARTKLIKQVVRTEESVFSRGPYDQARLTIDIKQEGFMLFTFTDTPEKKDPVYKGFLCCELVGKHLGIISVAVAK